MDTPLLCSLSAWAMEAVNLQTQKSIAELTYALADKRTVELFPVFLSFLNYVIRSCYFMFNLYLFLFFPQQYIRYASPWFFNSFLFSLQTVKSPSKK